MNLIQKLAEIRKMSNVVKKDKKGYNYSYSDITEILAKVTAGMKKYNVSLIPSIVPGTARITKLENKTVKFDRSGNQYDNVSIEMLVQAEMLFTWVDDDNQEDKLQVPWIVTGSQQDPSQAFGSGLTYCTRYFLCNFFQIAQTDTDVDTYRTKQKEAEDAEQREIAAEIISAFDIMVRKFLADNKDESDNVKKFVSEYVKNGNYNAIKEPRLASRLMEDFKKKYNIKEEDI